MFDNPGALGVWGTVVAVIELLASDSGELPTELVATTLDVYCVPDRSPCTVTGEEAPLPVKDPGVEVTLYDVAGGESGASVNGTDAAPLLNALSVPTSVAVPIIGLNGSKKSLADWLILPACFDIYVLPYYFL